MKDTEVDWFYEPFHLPKIQEKGRINAKIYVLQNHRYRFVYWGFLCFVFLHWRSSACTKSTNSLIKSQLLDLSSLSQRLDVGGLVFFLSNKKIKCLKSNLCWFIRIYICTLYMYINNLLNSVAFVLLLNKPIAS